MKPCAVCGGPGVSPLVLNNGTTAGWSCSDDCRALLWEGHFLASFAAEKHERAELQWRVRRRRAEVEGRPFTESPPTSPGERAATAEAIRLGVF